MSEMVQMPQRKKLTKSEKDQERRGFRDWLAQMDLELRQFITSLPSQVAIAMDFSPQSLKALEAWLLEKYPTMDALRVESEATNWDRLGRYIGETMRRNTDGRWDIELEDPHYVYFKVPHLDFAASSPVCPRFEATVALDRRTGRILAGTLERKIADMEAAASNNAEQLVPPFDGREMGGLWLVMFADPSVTLDDAAASLRNDPAWTVSVKSAKSSYEPPRYIEVMDEGHIIIVSLNANPEVLEESREIAEQFGAGRVDQVQIAACDRRFEISYELEDIAASNCVLLIEHALRALPRDNTSITFIPADATFP